MANVLVLGEQARSWVPALRAAGVDPALEGEAGVILYGAADAELARARRDAPAVERLCVVAGPDEAESMAATCQDELVPASPAAVTSAVRRALARVAGQAAARHRDTFFDHSLDMLCIADFQGRFVELNPAWSALGWSIDELRSRPFLDFVHPDDVAPTLEIMGRLTTSSYATISFENRYRCQDGSYRWLLWSSRTNWNAERPEDRMYFAVARDITERKAQEALLRDQTEKLARSNADLEQFAHLASHDLQEPLRMVNSYVQLLSRRYKGQLDEQADRYIHFASDGAQRMHALINDLLAFSRVTSQGVPLRPVDAGAVLGRALEDMRALLTERQAEVQAGELPEVLADAGQLRQVFQNLVGNAVKFCRPEVTPRVEIGARREGDLWSFSVADNGIGIEPAHFERIFQLFQRLHGRGEYPGTGLGLAIVKKIVERHGGQIRVESEPDRGTTFHFTLRAVGP